MAAHKKVLLVFLPSESGVDGARSLYSENRSNPLTTWFNGSLRTLIKKSQFAIPPLSLMILSSIEVPGVEQSICDMRFEAFPFHESWDLVGLSVQTGMARQAFDLADRLRREGTPVALGGAHVTLFPDSCRPHADLLVHGEADDLWKEVLTDLKSGCLKPDYYSGSFPDMSIARPVSKASLVPGRYFTTNLIQTGRGCPHSCDFCNVHVLNGHTLRRRAISDIVSEVARFQKYDRRIFFFVDDSINADPAYARELFHQLAPLKISWFGQATTTLGQQHELLETFARSGCRALLVGIESIEAKSRSAHKKNQNRSTELAGAIKNIREAGISLYGSFIYGLDGDTLETPAAILDFIRETGLDVPGINILRPTPGTRVFERLREEGRLLFDPRDITAFRYTFGQEMLYRPKNIDLEAFVESYSTLTRKIFTIKNSVTRGFAAPSAKAAVMLFNMFYTHLYGLSRHDLKHQLAANRLENTILPYAE
ncbi:B12-binding domain-containing radical SAM protein [Chlorobium sp. BLA1]|uniref:B12-binding domain-containing radical SAM protein n=1 Tax=Candidatus Chlorobium masyuteum TaxID=2716876 RepID=UPI00141F1047|nr:radical SAM protein [Candidatus Chlorobium masyuteum]NHQ59492.1 B12-binding domain-containing radical SAM protein [Candidatus Chlorobium masyuteum]